MRSDYDGGGKVTRRTKYNKSLRVLAETNGISLSTLEYRLRLGMNIKDALAEPTRSREVTKKDLQKCNHLTFNEACLFLGIDSRKLNRLSKMYDVYFRRKSHTKDNESKVIAWCALHSPILRLKNMARCRDWETVSQSRYFQVMYDETPDGDLIQCDMTQILLNQEKYRRLLGDMNVQDILAQMHPTQSTIMDGMTDEERFACVISRHSQTMSERQAVLQQLASEKSELTAYAEAMLAEQQSAPDPSPAPDAPAQ